jgi:carbonic anhydrase
MKFFQLELTLRHHPKRTSAPGLSFNSRQLFLRVIALLARRSLDVRAFLLLQSYDMRYLNNLLENNKEWAGKIKAQEPDFFQTLSKQQSPEYLWVGCSDSRVPSTEIVKLMPGELFVHRNVANVVVHTDLNCLSVMQYAVDVLKVKHIIVCGHYGCGGVLAALQNVKFGLIDNWLRHVQDVMQKHAAILEGLGDEAERLDKLCELNVIEQVSNVCQTTIVQNAWERNQELAVHGWIYGLSDGLLRDLNICITSQDELAAIYNNAIAAAAVVKTQGKSSEQRA